jgi:DUF971 family protein
MKPTSMKQRTPDSITITWDDGASFTPPLELIRKRCPCATCLHEASEQASEGLFPLMLAGQTRLAAIEQSGRNAVIFVWGDGHRTGIYTWEYLRQLCDDFEENRTNPGS